MPNVKWKPDGYHSITPYLTIRGAEKAIEFYKKVFNAEEIERMPGPGGKIMHCELKIGDSMLMLSDEFPEMGCKSPEALNGSPVSVFVYVEDVDKLYENATKNGAKADRPPQTQFWGDRYGSFIDPFGHRWSVATHVEDVSPEEMKRRADEFHKQMAGAHK